METYTSGVECCVQYYNQQQQGDITRAAEPWASIDSSIGTVRVRGPTGTDCQYRRTSSKPSDSGWSSMWTEHNCRAGFDDDSRSEAAEPITHRVRAAEPADTSNGSTNAEAWVAMDFDSYDGGGLRLDSLSDRVWPLSNRPAAR